MKTLVVKLWNKELGRLVWDPAKKLTYFVFNPDTTGDRPDVSPLLHPAGKGRDLIPAYGDSRKIYQSLPPFIADSLPDSWGNRLFDQWVKQNHIPRNKITPLYKLMFIGKRGMGALEFEPAAKELEHSRSVDIKALYDLSIEILEERESVVLSGTDNLTLQTLLAVGTSAGGRQMKAIIAYNPATKEIRSGQTDVIDGFEYNIIKFEDKVVPTSEIEMSFYDMATAAGIYMEESRLIEIDGIRHFMTRRFDRKNGEKVHMQTLAAINPEAESYEDLMATCRSLGLSETELVEVYRRLVFNVIANNTDDHNKNFSFLLEKNDRWKLSPAYDLTFIFNTHGTGPETFRCMSLYGKTDNISKQDLLDFAKDNNIRNAEEIIAKVAEAVAGFPELAEKYRIPSRWSHIIKKTIQDNLISFGLKTIEKVSELTVPSGRVFKDITVTTNSKGIYDVEVVVDGKRRRNFVKPGTAQYGMLNRFELNELDTNEVTALFEDLFPIT